MRPAYVASKEFEVICWHSPRICVGKKGMEQELCVIKSMQS
jgi:hypothetical protein